MARLDKTQKSQIAWTRLEGIASALYWALVVCGAVEGVLLFLERIDILSTPLTLAVLVFGIPSILLTMIILSILLFVIAIILAFMLKQQNYHRLVPLILGVVILEILWYPLLIGITIDYNIWVDSVYSIMTAIVTIIVGVMALICYRRAYLKDISERNATRGSFMRRHRTVKIAIVVTLLAVLFVFTLLFFFIF